MNALAYNGRIWAITCFFGPVLAYMLSRLANWQEPELNEIGAAPFILFSVLLGLLFSLPALLIASLSTHLLLKRMENARRVKIIQGGISMLLAFFSLYVALGETYLFLILWIAYSVVITIATIFTRLYALGE